MIDHVAPIIQHNGSVLFIQRAATKKSLPNAWSFPSGTQERGETIEATTVRECNEELGITVIPEYVLAVKELPEFEVRLHFVVCSMSNGQPVINEPSEIQSFRWMSFKDFFSEYDNTQIGHGLVWLRANQNVWRDKF